MEEKTQLSGVNLFFLWFGAAVSVAEILTGGYLAELGAAKGLWAILLGHLAGTLLLVLAGLIGFRERVPAIMSTRISFGKQGSYLISVINILQLIWTAIMIIQGGTAMNVIAVSLWNFNHPTLMSCLVGFLVSLWVFWGVKGFKRINTLASALLLVLTVVMSWVVFTHPAVAAEAVKQKGAFGMGFELSIIMPLSWFPLISDYTSLARTKKGALIAPFCGYFVGSCWMYMIGMAGGLLSGSPDPTKIMLAANLGLTALAILGLSTVTTTFLDGASAGIAHQYLPEGERPDGRGGLYRDRHGHCADLPDRAVHGFSLSAGIGLLAAHRHPPHRLLCAEVRQPRPQGGCRGHRLACGGDRLLLPDQGPGIARGLNAHDHRLHGGAALYSAEMGKVSGENW
jgi:putative hydroxymethylpyrimidine transporter CytX